MSTKYQKSEDVPLDVIIFRLRTLSNAMVAGRDEKEREFTIRIPAECDRDADIVLEEAASRLSSLQSESDELRARVAMLEAHFSNRPNVHDRDLRVEYARWADGLQVANTSAWLLRRDADAVHALNVPIGIACGDDPHEVIDREVQRLRQAADEAEKGK